MQGKYFERVVEVLERSIDPYSRIERDVMLPNIKNGNNDKCQCDLVIFSGIPPRETITIFEVQDRSDPVKINDFRGWLIKRDDVGAGQLVCVSRAGFPKSIINYAQKEGSRVKLITLNKEISTDENIPLFASSFKYRHFDITNVFLLDVFFPSDKAYRIFRTKYPNGFTLNEPIIEYNSIQTTLFKLLRNQLLNTEQTENKRIRVEYKYQNTDKMFFKISNFKTRFSFLTDFEYKLKIFDVPVSVLSYEQNNYGRIGWVLLVRQEIEGRTIDVKIPIILKNEAMQIGNVVSETEIEVNFKAIPYKF